MPHCLSDWTFFSLLCFFREALSSGLWFTCLFMVLFICCLPAPDRLCTHTHMVHTEPLYKCVLGSYYFIFFGSILRTIILRRLWTIGFFGVVFTVELWDLAIRRHDLFKGGERKEAIGRPNFYLKPSCIASRHVFFCCTVWNPPTAIFSSIVNWHPDLYFERTIGIFAMVSIRTEGVFSVRTCKVKAPW